MIISILLRTHLSIAHLRAATYHARQALHLPPATDEATSTAQFAHVTGAVSSSAAFIEATINEVTERDKKGFPLALLNALIVDRGGQPFEMSDPLYAAAELAFSKPPDAT